MFFAEGQIRVHLYGEPTDMRKSYDGLHALALHAMQRAPLDGALYVFVNRRGTQLKALYFDRSGFCIWAKRLEAGRFIRPAHKSLRIESRRKRVPDGDLSTYLRAAKPLRCSSAPAMRGMVDAEQPTLARQTPSVRPKRPRARLEARARVDHPFAAGRSVERVGA